MKIKKPSFEESAEEIEVVNPLRARNNDLFLAFYMVVTLFISPIFFFEMYTNYALIELGEEIL